MTHTLLENDVKIDKNHIFREEKSSAPHRKYKFSSIWLFGAKQRNSTKFILIPLKDRKEETFIQLFLLLENMSKLEPIFVQIHLLSMSTIELKSLNYEGLI